MSTQRCLTCGRIGPVDGHHVAGRCNDPDLIVDLCVPCHKVVTSWQYASGINLADGPRTEVDTARATLVGCAHLFELFLARHPELELLEPDQAQRAGRHVSMGLDLLADPDREGRWTPDAKRTRVDQIRSSRRQVRESLGDWQRFMTVLQFLLANGVLKGGVLETVPRLVGQHPAVSAVIDLVGHLGGLVVAASDGGRGARELAGRLDPESESDRVLALTMGALTLGVILSLQVAQFGLGV